MKNLISKDDIIKTTPIYIGYLILKDIKKKKESKITIFEAMESIKKDIKILHYRQVLLALIFLYSSGLIDFSAPYIYKL